MRIFRKIIAINPSIFSELKVGTVDVHDLRVAGVFFEKCVTKIKEGLMGDAVILQYDSTVSVIKKPSHRTLYMHIAAHIGV
jgi:hypothetical protein